MFEIGFVYTSSRELAYHRLCLLCLTQIPLVLCCLEQISPDNTIHIIGIPYLHHHDVKININNTKRMAFHVAFYYSGLLINIDYHLFPQD